MIGDHLNGNALRISDDFIVNININFYSINCLGVINYGFN